MEPLVWIWLPISFMVLKVPADLFAQLLMQLDSFWLNLSDEKSETHSLKQVLLIYMVILIIMDSIMASSWPLPPLKDIKYV
jgi:hypothetical protein